MNRHRVNPSHVSLTLPMSFLLEAAAVLAILVHPNHSVYLCIWECTHLPPTCNSTLFGYISLLISVVLPAGKRERLVRLIKNMAAVRLSSSVDGT
ncbi:hypothetical protein C7R88_14320 [Plesiomonas shigelloides]|nr:hypothetical protein C7R88_14320 [Plesiomonas shigelloides]